MTSAAETTERADHVDVPPSDPDAPWAGRVVAGATVLAALLVSFRIGSHGLWYDEGFTIGTVDRPLGDALWRIANWELNQSPYHLLILGWQRVVEDEAALRALSAVFAVASVPLTYVLGRRLLGARVGAIAAVLLAVHPFVIEWGQQLRGYSLLLLLALATTLLLVRAVEHETPWRITAYAVVAALAVYVQFFAILLIAAHAGSLLLLRPFPRRLAIQAGAIGGVLLLPVAEFLLTREGDPLYWVEEPSQTQVNATAAALAGGARLQLVVYGLVAAVGLGVLVRRALARTDPVSTWRAALPVLVLVVPPVATLALSVTVKPLLEARFLMVSVPGLVLVAAVAIDRLARPWGHVALAGVLAVSAAGLWSWYDREPFDQWREAIAAIADTAMPGDVILTDPPRAVHVVRHYVERGDVPVSVGYPADMAAADPAQVYVLVRYLEEQPAPARIRPGMDVWLSEHYRQVDEQRFANVQVLRLEQT